MTHISNKSTQEMFLKHRKHIAVARKQATYAVSPSLLSTKVYLCMGYQISQDLIL